jgi:hypothetical protein
MDDGDIVGSEELLCKVWEILKSKGPSIGLHLNPAKCEWIWLNPECVRACPISVAGGAEAQLQMTHVSNAEMLGVPLGSDEAASRFVDRKLLGGSSRSTLEKLTSFEDTQAAMYLLRVSFGTVWATHFMRTTPISQWLTQASEFDSRIRNTAEQILGAPLSDDAYDQASVSPRLGGLGLRKVVDHAEGLRGELALRTDLGGGEVVVPCVSPSPS